MRYRRLIVFEGDGKVTGLVQPIAEEVGCLLRQVQLAPACIRALQRGGRNVFILRTGRDLDREFGLLDQVSQALPETRCLVALDHEDARLEALAWDLGATYVLPLARLREELADLV